MAETMDVPEVVTEGLQVSVGGFSSAGYREANQDAFAVKYSVRNSVVKYKGVVACIADGVSCSDNGQQASHTSVTQFIDDYYSTPNSWGVRKAAAKVLTSLNSWLYHHGQQSDLRHNGLVTTFSSVIVKSNTAHLIHVGDSRIYRYRAGKLTQLTQDHSRKQGGKSHFLTRALGMDSRLDVDYQQEPVEVDDVLVLTTDGLHDWLSKQELEGLMSRTELATEELAHLIVQYALKKGSDDNLTCLLVKIDSLPQENLQEVIRQLTQRVIPPVLVEGNRIDQYEIIRVLHSGTRSHVYLAKSHFDTKYYVLKAPSPNFSDDLVYLQGFIREGWIGRQITHTSVMKIHRYADTSPFLYHVCDYVEGKTLRQWMIDNPEPSLEKVRQVAAELVKPIRFFQRMGIVHRDLKPENIILTENGKAVFIDFGTAQAEGIDEITAVIKEEVPVGATDYIAPEYLAGEQATVYSDLFSVGVIVYEMLTGKLPYRTRYSQVFDGSKPQYYEYVSATKNRPDLPSWLDLVLKKVCHPSPDIRYQVISEFIHDLSTPNPKILRELKESPLIQRNPLRFWKVMVLVLVFVVCIETYIIALG
ncbi:bifunctional protein-serine/threonine kinase/phosphatase [Photobacterium sp. SDRW27]|uniref:bifunctional protein-serine/threonine kinase/phosphatase n=1 Tax=Photobacterium obscurum TaxID=2829490 RepID=UPI0022431765|nr:bifunctional protein-serine/threonine kinase/phosphatase [Photobacterium obscurum]MCW8327439.1 bifunctional protein-serine/threonine kinase/phosphatase [Photobacterium obscurum]